MGLESGQTPLSTAAIAIREAAAAVLGAVPAALLPFAALGLWSGVRRRWRGRARAWLFLGVVASAWFLALARLHATGGYCTPRHALILALPLFAASASGLRAAATRLKRAGLPSLRPMAVSALAAFVLLIPSLPAVFRPVNDACGAYREAGAWLSTHVDPADRVADVTGWSLYYGNRAGYTFADLHAAGSDPAVRWVVARDAHLAGPWGYCARLRGLIAGARVVVRFPDVRQKGRSQVTVYQRPAATPAQAAVVETGVLR